MAVARHGLPAVVVAALDEGKVLFIEGRSWISVFVRVMFPRALYVTSADDVALFDPARAFEGVVLDDVFPGNYTVDFLRDFLDGTRELVFRMHNNTEVRVPLEEPRVMTSCLPIEEIFRDDVAMARERVVVWRI